MKVNQTKQKSNRLWVGSQHQETTKLNLGELRWLIEARLSLATYRGELPKMPLDVRLIRLDDKPFIRVSLKGLHGKKCLTLIQSNNQNEYIGKIKATIEKILWEFNGFKKPNNQLSLRFIPQVILT